MTALKDRSWTNWARHRAALILPYEPQQLTFYELYTMAVPLLVPDIELLPWFTRHGYGTLQDFKYQRPGWNVPWQELNYDWSENGETWELRWWIGLSDLIRMPHLLHWRSVPELLAKLFLTDLEALSQQMSRET